MSFLRPTPAGASILRMAAPLVISFWMRAAVTFVDTIYASFLGDAEIAAIGLTLPLEFLMIAAWVGLSTGLTSCLSRAMGGNEHSKIDQYLSTGWRMVWVITPVFILAGAAVWIVAPRLGLAADVAQSFRTYGTVLIGGSALTTFWSILPDSVIKAHHDTRSTMWAGIWSNVINLGLNSLFLFVFDWGIFGIAFSTVLGRIGGLAYAMVRAEHHEKARRAESEQAAPSALDLSPNRAILRLAIPSSLTFALMATEGALINALLAASRHATESIAAYSIYYRVVIFGLQPIIATSVALLPFAARRLGNHDQSGVRQGLRAAALATSLYSLVVLGPLMLGLGPLIARGLAESRLTAHYTGFALLLVPLACLVNVPFLLYRPVFEAMQQGRPGLIVAGVRYLLFTGPLAWLGMWIASRLGQPALHGLILGTLGAAALSSGWFYLWLRRAMREPA